MNKTLLSRRTALKLGTVVAAAGWLQPAFARTTGKPVLLVCTAIATLDPAHSRSSGGNLTVLSQTLSSLTSLEADGTLVGNLATEWQVEDAVKFTFKLNPAAKFQNGKVLNAHVVVWNFERMAAPEVKATANTNFDLIESVMATDDHTVVITTKAPWVDLPQRLSWMYMLEPEWTATNNPKVEINASGAYRLVSYEPGGDIVLEANPDYFGPATAIEKVTYRPVTSAAGRISGIQGGEIAGTLAIDPIDLTQLEGVPGYTVGAKAGQRYHTLKFNFNTPALADPRVRQAINYAIDKAAITRAVFRGHVDAGTTQVLNPQTEGFNPNLAPWPYDPAKAKELLAEAGYGSGLKLTLAANPGGVSTAVSPIAQILAAQFAEVGITLEVNLLPASAFTALRTQTEDLPDLTYAGYVSQSNTAAELFEQYSSKGPLSWGPMPPAFDAAVAAVRTATDQKTYVELIHAASQQMLDDVLVAFLWLQPQTFAVSNRINWDVRADDWVRATEMTWS